ncbi:MAG: glycerol kinase GlpK [Clostridia bacterium]|nr:glycerol kinase GlpK [Clostridia bacterium]
MGNYILALDEGTTSARAILFDRNGQPLDMVQREFPQIYPQPGWVEQDPMEIWASQYGVMMELIAKKGLSPDDIHAIGITNQRETVIVWERATGRPICNAIVWQCRRTAPLCEQLKEEGLTDYIRETTGLLIDAYFSATKLSWILDHTPGARERAKRGELCFGTVDSWLLWKLTGGAVHATDLSNASRTMLFDIKKCDWDDTLLARFDIPREMLPAVYPSGHLYGYHRMNGIDIPIAGMAGDQQAALFGQRCVHKGESKNTYGTGCFLLMNTGSTPVFSENGLLTTVAASLDGQAPQYALEGSVFVGGAVIQWLRDGLGIIRDAEDSEYFAAKAKDTGGAYLVPAFTGLGAPHWDMYARGTLVGMTRATGRNQIVRAALESIAFQTNDILTLMAKESGIPLSTLNVDGGASANDLLMQMQADYSAVTVRRPAVRESTALGAAFLAGITTGFWDADALFSHAGGNSYFTFTPHMAEEERRRALAGWKRALRAVRAWSEAEADDDEA